jgi:endoglucanase
MTTQSTLRRGLSRALAGALLLAAVPGVASAHHGAPARGLSANTRQFVPPPDPDGVQQVRQLVHQRRFRDAALVTREITTPQAVWFTKGTPREVEKAVRRTMRQARRQHAVPTLVAYDLPYRDCGQYSAGGARDTAEYERWIAAFARGIGDASANVILEPDGLGIIPFYTPLYGPMDWCRPTDDQGNPSPGADPQHRFAQLNFAVDQLEQQPGAAVYLDSGHSAWMGAGEAADRLIKAGVQRAQGFFTNVSNYRSTSDSAQFGTWVSDCIAFATNGAEGGWRLGHTDYCPGQYNAAGQADYGASQVASTNAWYASNLGTAKPTAHFVIDTSRNGQGPWTPPAGAGYPDPQDWCNPPGRGLGPRPRAKPASVAGELLDAYLWIKTPGQSDGQCNRGITGSTTDPEWGGIEDPAAGDWFPQQALQLAQLASPPLGH